MSYVHTNSKGVKWYLNCQEVTLNGGQKNTIFFFSRDERKTACDLPDTKQVVENPSNAFPICKNK